MKTYFRLFPTALALLLILTGCEKGIDKKTVWDSITNNIAGKYKITAISNACSDRVLDLDGDGVAHSDLMIEFTGLPNGLMNMNSMYTNVTRATPSERTGYINLNFPIQGIYVINGEIIPEWLIGGIAYVRASYTISDDYRIIPEDIKEPNADLQDIHKPDLNTLSDVHVSFSDPGMMQMAVSCLLYDFKTGEAEKERIVFTYERYMME